MYHKVNKGIGWRIPGIVFGFPLLIAVLMGRSGQAAYHCTSPLGRTVSSIKTSPRQRTKVLVTRGRGRSLALAATSTSNPTTTRISEMKTIPQPWTFQGHLCYAEVTRPGNTVVNNNVNFPFNMLGTATTRSRKKPEIVLIHGFGCSSFYWRETTRTLTEAGYTVHTVDLLGQGKSAKPGRNQGVEYSINLWAQLVEEYTKRFIPMDTQVVLMGNSLGSVVALSAATGDHQEGAITTASTSGKATLPSRIWGVGMFNCGVGMNSRNLLKDPMLNGAQRVIFKFLFDTLDKLIFDNIPLLTYALNDFVTRDVLRNALVGLYKCSTDPTVRVDDALVESFYLPAKDEGSVEALNQIYTNDAGKTPMELHEDYVDFLSSLPIHLVWGDEDQVTPLEGSVGQFYLNLSGDPNVRVSFTKIKAGHIPFDEVPECNDAMVQWLNNVVMKYEPQEVVTETRPSFKWPFPTSTKM